MGLGSNDPFTVLIGSLVFWIAAVAGVSAAYLMVFQVKNMVRAALALTTVLAGVAVMYALLSSDFLAAVQLVVYVGAIMVLMIFAIFMTPGQIDLTGLTSRGQRFGAFVVSILILLPASVFVIVAENWNIRTSFLEVDTLRYVGNLMLTRYVLPFEIASVLLTMALVGAIVVARED